MFYFFYLFLGWDSWSRQKSAGREEPTDRERQSEVDADEESQVEASGQGGLGEASGDSGHVTRSQQWEASSWAAEVWLRRLFLNCAINSDALSSEHPPSNLNHSIILGYLLCAAFISCGTCFLRSGVKSSLFFILLPCESSPVSLGVFLSLMQNSETLPLHTSPANLTILCACCWLPWLQSPPACHHRTVLIIEWEPRVLERTGTAFC